MMQHVAGSVVAVALLTGLTGENPPTDGVKAPKVEGVRHTMLVLKPLQTTGDWSGYVLDRELRAAAPQVDHVVRDAATWEMLWKTWNGGRDLPEVNFKEEVLFVFTTWAPNTPEPKLYLRHGHVGGTVARTCRGGPGFGYRILKVPRKDIKSFFGESIE